MAARTIAVLGTGYVGLVQAACLAELGCHVVGIDIDADKIASLNRGASPIYEPGLTELLTANRGRGRLHFTTDIVEGIADAIVIFLAVGTPSRPDGGADLQYIEQAAQAVGKALAAHRRDTVPVLTIKSTVPVGTGDRVEAIVRAAAGSEVAVVSNPEFLREGSAIQDFLHPDRIVLGGDPAAVGLLADTYAPLRAPVIRTDRRTAELTKYAANAYLATQISFINAIAQLAESVDADVTQIAAAMRLDSRIGQRASLHAGIGYGGSCFPKDVRALIHMARDAGSNAALLDAVEAINHDQRARVVERIVQAVPALDTATIAVWGLAFKANTDDVREAAALTIIPELARRGARVRAYDPIAGEQARRHLPDTTFVDDPYAAAAGADALVILTEWDEFRSIDLARLRSNLRQPVVVDGRNLYDRTVMRQHGFTYLSVGRPTVGAAARQAVAA